MQSLVITVVLLGCIAHALGDPLVRFGPCSEDCDGGYQQATLSTCLLPDGSATYPCETVSVTCNSQPCQNIWSTPWNTCNVTCEGGSRWRSTASGLQQIMPCNVIKCPKDLDLPSNCPADVIVALDNSASIGSFGFSIFKQMAMDVVRSLPVGQSEMHIGYVKYSANADNVFSLTDSYDKSVILDNIWASQYVGGTGCAGNALAAVRDMFAASATQGYPRVVIFFTDQPDSIASTRAYEIAQELRQNNVIMFAVQLGDFSNILLFANGEKFVFPVNVKTPSKLADAILVQLKCKEAEDVLEVDADDNLGDILKNGFKAKASPNQGCTEWTDYGPCSESCGETGFATKTKWCVTVGANGNAENITSTNYTTCFVPCPTTTTTLPTTTTVPTTTTTLPTTTTTLPTTTTTLPTTTTTLPTTTTTPGEYPDCRRCNYTKGQVWFPDPKNCHLYYICDKIDRMDGSWYFRVYHPTCGQLFWDQDRLTCVRSVPKNADCDMGDVITWDPPSTTYAPCPYKRMADPRFFQSIDNDLEIFQCTEGFEFFDSDDPCTCIPVKAIDPTCDNELLLHFPYEIDFDDVTCHKAKGFSYGEDGGQVQIVYDNERQENVAEFDGKSRIEVPFMRNWLQDQNQQAWTVTAWVKREQGPYDFVGIVDNGDCKDSASFLLYGNVESGNAVAYGGIAANNGFPATQTGSYVMPYNTWVQLGVVYNGADVKLYVGGVLQNVLTVPLGGAMLNTQNPLYIGMQGCCDENPGYFKGRIDDVRVYTVALQTMP